MKLSEEMKETLWEIMEEIKELYALRWGIETSFRELKYYNIRKDLQHTQLLHQS